MTEKIREQIDQLRESPMYGSAQDIEDRLHAADTMQAMLDVVEAAKSSLLRRHMRGEIYAGHAVDKLDDALAKLEEL